LSAIGGFIGMPEIFHAPHFFNQLLEPVTSFASAYHNEEISHTFEYLLLGGTILVLGVVIYMVYVRYVKSRNVPEPDHEVSGGWRLLANKFYFDEAYDLLITRPMDAISRLSYKWIEKGVIDGLVNSSGRLTNGLSGVLKFTQNGHLGFYVFGMVAAVLIMLILKLVI
jgi:NADH-quinone oxidoreductase subunit L